MSTNLTLILQHFGQLQEELLVLFPSLRFSLFFFPFPFHFCLEEKPVSLLLVFYKWLQGVINFLQHILLGCLSSFRCWFFILVYNNNKQDGENHMQAFEECFKDYMEIKKPIKRQLFSLNGWRWVCGILEGWSCKTTTGNYCGNEKMPTTDHYLWNIPNRSSEIDSILLPIKKQESKNINVCWVRRARRTS